MRFNGYYNTLPIELIQVTSIRSSTILLQQSSLVDQVSSLVSIIVIKEKADVIGFIL